MLVFEKPGKENTEDTLRLALDHAKKMKTFLVVASTGGETAALAARMTEKEGIPGKLIVVGSVPSKGEQKMKAEVLDMLRRRNVPVVFASHVLSGAERGLSTKMGGVYPVEIIAHSLRMLSQGVKVCVECSVMALDAGCLPFGEAIVAVGGTGHGADTACVLTPAGANDIFNCKIHEILCKPY